MYLERKMKSNIQDHTFLEKINKKNYVKNIQKKKKKVFYSIAYGVTAIIRGFLLQ